MFVMAANKPRVEQRAWRQTPAQDLETLDMNRNAPAHLIRPTGIALAVATLAALMGSAAAWAQNAPAPAGAASAPAAVKPAAATKADTATVIEIKGTRSSIQGSIARKRTASTVSDSIVAEDIDQFPDKNVGEALSRITGVQLTRQFGEGSQVSIRGVEPDLNRVEVNGASVPNCANWRLS